MQTCLGIMLSGDFSDIYTYKYIFSLSVSLSVQLSHVVHTHKTKEAFGGARRTVLKHGAVSTFK